MLTVKTRGERWLKITPQSEKKILYKHIDMAVKVFHLGVHINYYDYSWFSPIPYPIICSHVWKVPFQYQNDAMPNASTEVRWLLSEEGKNR